VLEPPPELRPPQRQGVRAAPPDAAHDEAPDLEQRPELHPEQGGVEPEVGDAEGELLDQRDVGQHPGADHQRQPALPPTGAQVEPRHHLTSGEDQQVGEERLREHSAG
jgi:hypothetical protein